MDILPEKKWNKVHISNPTQLNFPIPTDGVTLAHPLSG